jgi:hypothetical protein
MTDRKLLELAAKAAGIKLLRLTRDHIPPMLVAEDGSPWNPLTDDGDALRLAVKLGMDLGVYLATDREPGVTYANTKELLGYHGEGDRSYQNHGFFKNEHGDPCAATRRAITRAAAEIGKGMK